MYKFILLSAMLAACGALPGKKKGEGGSNQAGAPTPGPAAGGSDVDDDGSNTRTRPMIYAQESSLPECNDAYEQQIAYVSSSKKLYACASGSWSALDLKGEKGDKGDPGTQGAVGTDGAAGPNQDLATAITLYQSYRASIFRVVFTANRISNAPPACTDSAVALLGTAFLCGDKRVCTNQHVVTPPDACFEFGSLQLQKVEGEVDSVNSDGSAAAPFATITEDSAVTRHATLDLAVISINNNPSGAEPLPMSQSPAATAVTALAPILSLSFPLGLQDLYVDLGHVNAAYIGECDSQGGTSGYGCPGAAYDFSTTNDTDHGSSGSPLIDVRSGKVVGVTTAGTEGENANFTWATDAVHYADLEP